MAVKSFNNRKVIDFQEYQKLHILFFSEHLGVSSKDDSAHFSHSGCDCCNYRARAHKLSPLAADVYDCADIHDNELQLCGQCLCEAVNGDFSSFDFYADAGGFIQI